MEYQNINLLELPTYTEIILTWRQTLCSFSVFQIKFEALLYLYRTGRLAIHLGITEESFENIREEALQLATQCGVNNFAQYDNIMAAVATKHN